MSRWSKLPGMVCSLALAGSLSAQAKPAHEVFELPNADFESGVAPWVTYAGKSGTLAAGVGVSADLKVAMADLFVAGAGTDGDVGLVIPSSKKRIKVVVQCLKALPFQGKQLSIQGRLKEDGADGAFVVVQSRQGAPLGQSISSTYIDREGFDIGIVQSKISTAAHEVCIGVMAWGEGSVTFDDLQVTVADPKYAWNELKKPNRVQGEAIDGEPTAYTLVNIEGALVEAPVAIGTSDKKKKKAYEDQLKDYDTERDVLPFELGTHEVSRKLWLEVLPYAPWEDLTRCDDEGPDDELRPATCMSSLEAMLFANQLSLRDGLTPVYRIDDDELDYDDVADGYRLPSAAEWRLALNAGDVPAHIVAEEPGDVCAKANVRDETWAAAQDEESDGGFECEDGFEDTAPVGSFEAGENGLFDMMGNVREWVFVENDDGAVIKQVVVGTGVGSGMSAKGAAVANRHSPGLSIGLRLAKGATATEDEDADETEDGDEMEGADETEGTEEAAEE